MRFLADENIAGEIVKWARERGHDVLWAAEVKPGSRDEHWLVQAEDERRLILTADKDFGDLIFRDNSTSHGVVLLRLEKLTITQRLDRLSDCWAVVEANPSGSFIVITKDKIRVRPL